MRVSDEQPVYFAAGDAKFTRRVKKLSESRGLTVSENRKWNGYGYVTLGYHCDPGVYREVSEHIKREDERATERAEAKAARLAALQAEAERQRRLALETVLITRFPRLPDTLRAACLDRRTVAYSPDDELPTDEYSACEWRFLGCRVKTGQSPCGYVLRRQGVMQTPLFKPHALESVASKKADWDGARLWAFWRQGFGSDLLAIATAVRFANRLIKLSPFADHKKSVYEVKDRFIRVGFPHLRECRVSRVERRDCWGCDGTGVRGRQEYECERCDGSGVFSSRTLYEHLFMIEGEEFCFHSFVAPPQERFSDTPGANLTSYGRRFTPAELRSVRLRVPEFVRLLTHALADGSVALPTESRMTA